VERLMNIKYGVITKIDGPNVASMPIGETNDGKLTAVLEKAVGSSILWIEYPVFTVGEILIVDDDTDREIGYPGRAPHKWSGVVCQYFDDVQAAVACSLEVREAVG